MDFDDFFDNRKEEGDRFNDRFYESTSCEALRRRRKEDPWMLRAEFLPAGELRERVRLLEEAVLEASEAAVEQAAFRAQWGR